MSRNFVFKGIVLPVAAAVIICIAFVLFFRAEGERLVPFQSGIKLSDFDNLNPDDKTNDDMLSPNAPVGTVIGNGELKLRYEADYSNLLNSASLRKGSAKINEPGCIYIELTAGSVAKLISDSPVTVSTEDGEHTYKFVKEQLVHSEQEALSLSPSSERSMVIFYRVSKGIGLTSDYYALLYKGVD